MALDPRIILGFNPGQIGDLGKAAQDARQMQAVELGGQELAGQNALKQIFADPASVDATGSPTPNALRRVMQADPRTGMQFQQNMLRTQQAQLQTQMLGTKLGQQKLDMTTDANAGALKVYDDAIANGIPEPQAREQAQQALTLGFDRIRQSGLFSDIESNGFQTSFDPVRSRGYVNSSLDWQKQRTSDKREADSDRIRQEQLEQGRYTWQPGEGPGADGKTVAGSWRFPTKGDAKPEFFPGTVQTKRGGDAHWDILTDPDTKDANGNSVQYRYDKNSGKATTLAGEPYEPKGAARVATAVRAGSALSDDAANLIADRVLAGDQHAVTGLARNAENVTKVNEAIVRRASERGMDGPAIARKVAEFSGVMQAERTAAIRTTNMEIAANEVDNMAPLALSASAKVNRTQYPTLNGILESWRKGTGNTDVVNFALAANSLIYTYAKFLNPQGIPTDADKAKSTEILNTAWTKGQFSSAIEQIKREIKSGQAAVTKTKEEIGEQITGPRKDAAPPPAAAGGAQAAPAKAVSKAEYDALPKGAQYRHPNDPPGAPLRIKQ